jgi:hypothetical protein
MPEFRCDACGRLVSLDDLSSESAHRHLVTPDSDFSREEYETLCASCVVRAIARRSGVIPQ